MADCGLAFWENEKITIQDKLPDDPEEEVYQPYWEEMDEILTEYDDVPNDGSLKKTDVEALIRKISNAGSGCFAYFNRAGVLESRRWMHLFPVFR